MEYDFLNDNLKLVAEKYTDYNFGLQPASGTGDNWTRRILHSQYNSDSEYGYNYFKSDKDFIELIKRNKVDILMQLLYSPNYSYSVNAMESLIYLAAKNKLVIDDVLQIKMEAIRKVNFRITVRRSEDNFMEVNGYEALKMTMDNILRKYQQSLL